MNKKWEYLLASTYSGVSEKEPGKVASKQLNELGRQGWELVGFTETEAEYTWVLKREIS